VSKPETVAKNKVVGIVAEHDLTDSALTAFVRSLGYPAVIIEVDDPPAPLPAPLGAVIVRTSGRLARAVADSRCAGAEFAVVESVDSVGTRYPGTTVIPATNCAVRRLVEFLEGVLGVAERPDAISLSPREREVLATYVQGATVAQTAEEHLVATCTVRTHYRRVTDRYNAAGRKVANKSQLLLQMVADGWIRLPDGGPASAEGSDAGTAPSMWG